MRTKSVHVLNKSIPPVINVFKDKILKKGITIEQSFFNGLFAVGQDTLVTEGKICDIT